MDWAQVCAGRHLLWPLARPKYNYRLMFCFWKPVSNGWQSDPTWQTIHKYIHTHTRDIPPFLRFGLPLSRWWDQFHRDSMELASTWCLSHAWSWSPQRKQLEEEFLGS
jgi:hypothetical protein